MPGLQGAYGVDYSHARPTREQLTRDRTFTWTRDNGTVVRHDTPGGMRFACRYLLDAGRDRGKALQRTEALALNSWGIPIASNFEYAIGGVLFGYDQGVRDARTALAEILEIGIPRRVVYFSADVDVATSQIPTVLAYGEGAASVLGKDNVGFYGEYDLIEAAGRAGFRWGWQCYAWSRGLWSKHATVRQIRNHIFPDFDGDLNLAMADDIGAWSLTEPLEDEMNLPDKSTIPADLVPHYAAAGSPVKAGAQDTVERLLWLGPLRGLEARKGVAELAAAFRAFAATEATDDAAERAARAELAAKADTILATLSANADPQVLARAIVEALPADYARALVHDIGQLLATA